MLIGLTGVLLLAAIHARMQFLPEGWLHEAVGRWSFNIVFGGASVAILMRAVRSKLERGAWALLGIGASLWTIGNIYYTAVLWNSDAIPVPSVADYFWMGLYPFAYAGVVLMARARSKHVQKGLWLDGAVAALAVGAIAATIVLDAVVETNHGSTTALTINTTYVLADLTLLGLVFGAVAMKGWRLERTWAYAGTSVRLSEGGILKGG